MTLNSPVILVNEQCVSNCPVNVSSQPLYLLILKVLTKDLVCRPLGLLLKLAFLTRYLKAHLIFLL
jgi:hypothetical protein